MSFLTFDSSHPLNRTTPNEKVIIFSTREIYAEKLVTEYHGNTPYSHKTFYYDLFFAIVLNPQETEILIVQKIHGSNQNQTLFLESYNPLYTHPSQEEKKNKLLFCISEKVAPHFQKTESVFVAVTSELHFSILGIIALNQGGTDAFNNYKKNYFDKTELIIKKISKLKYISNGANMNYFIFPYVDHENLVKSLNLKGYIYSELLAQEINKFKTHDQDDDYEFIDYWNDSIGNKVKNKKSLKEKIGKIN